jgi:hypothetical protein
MKILKAKLLAAAVSSLAVANAAQALNPTDTANADISVYISGGGAADANLELVIKALLNAGGVANIDTYTYNGAKSDFWAVSGIVPNASVLGPYTGSKKVAFYKRTNGAAFQGVGPVAANASIAHLDITQIIPANYNAATHTGNITGTLNLNAGAGTGLKKTQSDAGITDVNPELFTSPINVPSSEVVPGPADIAKLIVKPTNAAVHGVAVTKTLRNALQTQQGLTAGAEDEANIPSLSRAAIASIYQGTIYDWTQIVHNGVRLVVPAGFSSEVYVVPRSPGAAIQASVNARILNAPSSPIANGPAAQSLAFAPYVYEAALPGDVDKILDGLDKGTATGSWNDGSGVAHPLTGVKALAIGSQSTEKNTDDAANSGGKKDLLNYRFIKIDGVAPTLRNTYNGTYPLVVEQVITYRGGAAANPLSGIKKAIVDYLVKESATPSILGSTNAKFYHGYGQTGYSALSINGFAVGAFNNVLPVTGYTFGPAGINTDLGRTPILDNSSVDGSGNLLAPDLITK